MPTRDKTGSPCPATGLGISTWYSSRLPVLRRQDGLAGATAADAESIASGGAMTQPAIRSEPFSLGNVRALRPAKRTRNPSEDRNSGPYRNVHLCGYVRNSHTFPNENGSLRGRCRQIAPYSRSSMPMSVLPSFLRTFFTTARSTTLSFISVTGEPSRSLTVALSRLRTS